MATIEIAKNISLSTERAESSYGVPVLVIGETAYGPGDFESALFAELKKEAAPFEFLIGMSSGETELTALVSQEYGYESEEMKMLNRFFLIP